MNCKHTILLINSLPLFLFGCKDSSRELPARSDPHEIENLSSRPEYSMILESMKRKIKDFQFSTRDPWMIVWDNESVIQGTGVNL